MNKKELKWYEAPAMEVVELETIVSLLAGSKDEDDSTNEGMDRDRD